MSKIATACTIAALAVTSAASAAPVAPAARPAPARLTVDSAIHDLFANPRTKPVMDKHFPNLTKNPHYFMLEGMSIRQMAPMAQGKLDAAGLAKINGELEKAK